MFICVLSAGVLFRCRAAHSLLHTTHPVHASTCSHRFGVWFRVVANRVSHPETAGAKSSRLQGPTLKMVARAGRTLSRHPRRIAGSGTATRTRTRARTTAHESEAARRSGHPVPPHGTGLPALKVYGPGYSVAVQRAASRASTCPPSRASRLSASTHSPESVMPRRRPVSPEGS